MNALDVVVTLQEIPGQRVPKGAVGTVVEGLEDRTVLVEFPDQNGITYAIVPVPVKHLRRDGEG